MRYINTLTYLLSLLNHAAYSLSQYISSTAGQLTSAVTEQRHLVSGISTCGKQTSYFSSFSDSVIFQLHPIYQALQLVLYADEFDVVNPLGVHASVYKMLAFYFTVANISSCLQSKTDMIQVLAICDISDVEVHGLQESPADAGIPARRKNDEKNSSISKL